MHDRTEHLDLLADHVVEIIGGLQREAVREAVSDATAINICKIKPSAIHPNGQPMFDAKTLQYADGLMEDVFSHIASKWSEFREIQRRLCSASAMHYDENGDFDL
ncbi:MAG: hypothetical protein P4L67_05135 [Candidatus Pacebacteria bacterium]|nr:hypothetical protein [Candidatus Paceibacterota bacterium]